MISCRKGKQQYKIDWFAHSIYGLGIYCYSSHVGLQVFITITINLCIQIILYCFSFRFSCRGHDMSSIIREQPEINGRSFWILAYVIFIGFLTSSVCGFWSCIQDHEDSCRFFVNQSFFFNV